MKLSEYQRRARETNQPDIDLTAHLIGLCAETGAMASVSKTRMRYGEAFGGWRKQVREELGDILWHVAAIADDVGLDLDDIAQANLHRTRARWLPSPGHQLDISVPPDEQLPRRGTYIFSQQRNAAGRWEVQVHMDGRQVGNPLTDNALNEDGYRFHDVFHLAYAAILGWSPVTRSLLRRKRKSVADIDEAEDGGRGIVIEEGVSSFVFTYASLHNHFDGITRLDQAILDSITLMTATLEVGVRSAAEWESAILQGHAMFRQLLAHGGGAVEFDADHRTLRYLPQA
ncbi:nucleoside triphosphate pyrophosphohydrolase family protein [Nocardia alni]|uniref:nucleoside triphosphate pyrophosphohydrolase family protein n=1 Tax=Nocardia alni TaxID=2815723 RepID=UPI001C245AD7|nr:nucleoside triphosphate pyrophosphohydrolase family protein [Nocardia alni]